MLFNRSQSAMLYLTTTSLMRSLKLMLFCLCLVLVKGKRRKWHIVFDKASHDCYKVHQSLKSFELEQISNEDIDMF